jgi:hypothetical protein
MGVVMERWCPTQQMLGVFLMKKALLAGVAALLMLSASAAHATEWQGNIPKPVGKLPPYPPIVCVTPNWTPEPCENRQPNWLKALGELFKWLEWLEWTKTNWLGTVIFDVPRPWDGKWPRLTTVLRYEPGGVLHEHEKRWWDLARSGDDVEIRDMCASACTMIMAYVPRERMCFGERSALLFHASRNATDKMISVSTTVRMFYSYPKDIQEWLRERGGLAVGDVVALAKDLWAMGYRKCGPDLHEQEIWKEKDRKAEEAWKEWQKTFEPPDPNEVPIPMTIVKSTKMGTGG